MHTTVATASSLLLPLLPLLLHPLAATSQFLSPKQQAAFSSAANRIEALHTNPGFSAFREDINTRLERFLSTQTIQPDAQDTDQPEAPLQFALVGIEHEWARTQTFVTGAAKETVVDAINQFLDTKETGSGVVGGGSGGGIRRVVTVTSTLLPSSPPSPSPAAKGESNDQNSPPPPRRRRPATRTTEEAIPSDIIATVDEKDEAPSPAAARKTNGVRLMEGPAAAAVTSDASGDYGSTEYGPIVEGGGERDAAREEGAEYSSTATTLETETATKPKMEPGKSASSHSGSGVATATGNGYDLPAPTAAQKSRAAGGMAMAGQNRSMAALVMVLVALVGFF